MKLSTVALSTLFGLASAAQHSIRAGSPAPPAVGQVAVVNAVIHGLSKGITEEEVGVIAQSITSSYNKVYKSAGYAVKSFSINGGFEAPVRSEGFEELILVGELSVYAQDSSRSAASADTGDLHGLFEKTLCEDIQATGYSNLVQARDCSFSFLEQPGQSGLEAAAPLSEASSNTAQITLIGSAEKLSASDMKLIDNSVMEAFTESFAGAEGVSLDGFEATTVFNPNLGAYPYWDWRHPENWRDWQCRLCPADDDALVEASSTEHAEPPSALVIADTKLGWDWRGWGCRLCPADDDALVAAATGEQLAAMHESFEVAFCDKLKNSGTSSFAALKDCFFDFMTKPSVSEEEVTSNLITDIEPAATLAEVNVVVGGLAHGASEGEVSAISNSITSAYNKVLGSVGYSVDALDVIGELESHVAADGSEQLMLLAQMSVKADNKAPALEAGSLQATFEKTLCEEIRKTGFGNLAGARDCSFNYLERPGVTVADSSTPMGSNAHSNTAQITLQDSAEKLSASDMKLIDNSVMEAFTESFAGAEGVSLDGFEATTVFNPNLGAYPYWDWRHPENWRDWQCRLCPADDDALVEASSTEHAEPPSALVIADTKLGWDWRGWGCRLCPADDDALVAAATGEQLAAMHESFEVAFCNKLKNSGASSFAALKDCSFRFMANPEAAAVETAIE